MQYPKVLRHIKREVGYYRAVMADPGTPAGSRWLLAAAFAYLLSPIDLIPDFLPVIGYVDDLIIVGGLVVLARLFIPKTVLRTHRGLAEAKMVTNSKDEYD